VTMSKREITHPIVGANWKMQKSIAEGAKMASLLAALLNHLQERTIFICVPFTALSPLESILHEAGIWIGAQDVFWQDWGAYTGEVSAPMLKELGVDVVMVGHSERRHLFGESDEQVNLKAKAVIRHDLIPVICVGETLEERQAGKTFEVLSKQIDAALTGISAQEIRRSLIAYEPVWAIGTGHTATAAQATEAHAHIRAKINELYDKDLENGVHLIYGGSVNPANAASIASSPHVDGLFVGGASLDANTFAEIAFLAGEAV
jgi:triosephosphate isomerase